MSNKQSNRDSWVDEILEKIGDMPEERREAFLLGLDRLARGQEVYEAFSEFVPEYISQAKLEEIAGAQ